MEKFNIFFWRTDINIIFHERWPNTILGNLLAILFNLLAILFHCQAGFPGSFILLSLKVGKKEGVINVAFSLRVRTCKPCDYVFIKGKKNRFSPSFLSLSLSLSLLSCTIFIGKK